MLTVRMLRRFSNTTARALQFDTPGPCASALKFVDNIVIPESIPSSHVHVSFLAAPVNPSDRNVIEGTYPLQPVEWPATGGSEGIAVVRRVGASVQDLSVGDWVVPMTPCLGW